MTDFKNWTTGLSIHFGNGYSEKHFEEFKKSGIGAIEISLRFGTENDIDWDAVKRESERTGMIINSYHLPFSGNYTISDTDEERR